MIPDPYRKTVRIPVRIFAGRVRRLDGRPLPKLTDRAVGDLVVAAFSVEDEEAIRELEEAHDQEILPKESFVFLGVGLNVVPPEKHKLLIMPSKLQIPADYGFVEVRLAEPLKLLFRGSKSAVLMPCECLIPVLKKRAESLNHAFTIISSEFETQRLSHTGNVFQRAFVHHGDRWRVLNEFRGVLD